MSHTLILRFCIVICVHKVNVIKLHLFEINLEYFNRKHAKKFYPFYKNKYTLIILKALSLLFSIEENSSLMIGEGKNEGKLLEKDNINFIKKRSNFRSILTLIN